MNDREENVDLTNEDVLGFFEFLEMLAEIVSNEKEEQKDPMEIIEIPTINEDEVLYYEATYAGINELLDSLQEELGNVHRAEEAYKAKKLPRVALEALVQGYKNRKDSIATMLWMLLEDNHPLFSVNRVPRYMLGEDECPCIICALTTQLGLKRDNDREDMSND